MTIFLQLLPVLMPILAPIATALLEKMFAALNIPVPKPLLPVVNAASGIVLASLAGAPPQTAVLAGPVGAMVGNRVREAYNKPNGVTQIAYRSKVR